MASTAARRITATALALAATTSAVVVSAGPASAKGSDVVRVNGACSPGGSWKLKAGDEGSRLEVEFEVESGRAGQTWAVTITDNGTAVFRGSARTAGASPSFEVRRLVTDRSGADRLVATARNTTTGARCQGVLTVR